MTAFIIYILFIVLHLKIFSVGNFNNNWSAHTSGAEVLCGGWEETSIRETSPVYVAETVSV